MEVSGDDDVLTIAIIRGRMGLTTFLLAERRPASIAVQGNFLHAPGGKCGYT